MTEFEYTITIKGRVKAPQIETKEKLLAIISTAFNVNAFIVATNPSIDLAVVPVPIIEKATSMPHLHKGS